MANQSREAPKMKGKRVACFFREFEVLAKAGLDLAEKVSWLYLYSTEDMQEFIEMQDVYVAENYDKRALYLLIPAQ
jgi:hypothetical protein